MILQLGAAVRTSDGTMVGKVSDLVVDPDKQTLDGVAVHTGWLGGDLIVPIRNVRAVGTDATVHLSIPEEVFRSLPPLTRASFADAETADESLGDFTAGGGQLPMPVAGIGAPMTSIGQEFDPGGGALGGMPNTGYDGLETESNLEEGEVTIAKDTRVVTADGHHVGTVREVRVAADGKLEGFTISSGHLITHEHFVGADEVDEADPEGVRLRVTAAQFAALAGPTQQDDAGPTA